MLLKQRQETLYQGLFKATQRALCIFLECQFYLTGKYFKMSFVFRVVVT